MDKPKDNVWENFCRAFSLLDNCFKENKIDHASRLSACSGMIVYILATFDKEDALEYIKKLKDAIVEARENMGTTKDGQS